MLHYIEAAASPLEVPGERALCIYICGCTGRCPGCHYPELQQPDGGDPLQDGYEALLQLYRDSCTCVCFLGEGENTLETRRELRGYVRRAQELGLRTCLYSGRDTEIEDWMRLFDYIKLGSWRPDRGPLTSPSTNQRMFQKTGEKYQEITVLFLNEKTNSFAQNNSF